MRFPLPVRARAFATAVALSCTLASAGVASAATTVFSTDFESGIPAAISAPGSVLDGVQGFAGLGTTGHTFGGSFLRYTTVALYPTTLTLTGLPAHDTVDLDFLLAVIDSWDGTELFKVSVDGTELFSHWFQLAQGDSSDYIAPPGALLSRGTDLGFTGGGYYNRDRAYDMTLEPAFHAIPHTASTLTVTWSIGAVSGSAASQWQGGSDESWAIDGVRVSVSNSLAAVAPGVAPTLALALASPNPSADGALAASVTLPAAGSASLELLDVQGRRVLAREVGALGAGTHRIALDAGVRLAPGVYTLRLAQAGVARSLRAVVLR